MNVAHFPVFLGGGDVTPTPGYCIWLVSFTTQEKNECFRAEGSLTLDKNAHLCNGHL